MNNLVIKLLDLKAEDICSIDTIVQTNQSDFLITLKQVDQISLHCGSLTKRIKDYKVRK